MFDTISSSVWLAVTTTSLVLIFLGVWLYLWHTQLVRRHNQHITDIADLETRKKQLQAEIDQQCQRLDANQAEVAKIEGQRQKYERLKEEIETLKLTRMREEERLEEVRNKSVVLKSVVGSLTREQERMREQAEALKARIEDARLETAEAEKMKMMVVLRTNMALMDLKTKRDELQALTALHDQHQYKPKPALETRKDDKKSRRYNDRDSNQAESVDIQIKVV